MKTCTYCGQKCDDSAVNCSGCGLDEFTGDNVLLHQPNASSPVQEPDDQAELVTVATCQEVVDAGLVLAKLEEAGIGALIPDEDLQPNVTLILNTYGGVRVQVRQQDLANAKALLAQSAEPVENSPPLSVDDNLAIASLPGSVPPELLNRLKNASVPFKIQTAPDESGLETNNILVEKADYERGCDVVEAWSNDVDTAAKQRSRIACPQCGSKNYEQIPHDKLGHVYVCQDCGSEFFM